MTLLSFCKLLLSNCQSDTKYVRLKIALFISCGEFDLTIKDIDKSFFNNSTEEETEKIIGISKSDTFRSKSRFMVSFRYTFS